MVVIGIGCDVVVVARVGAVALGRYGWRILERAFARSELVAATNRFPDLRPLVMSATSSVQERDALLRTFGVIQQHNEDRRHVDDVTASGHRSSGGREARELRAIEEPQLRRLSEFLAVRYAGERHRTMRPNAILSYTMRCRWAAKEACYKALQGRAWELPHASATGTHELPLDPSLLLPRRTQEVLEDDDDEKYRLSAVEPRAGDGRLAVRFSDMAISSDENGRPQLELHSSAAEAARARGVSRVLVSLSHDGPWAFAAVVLEGA